ncbi:MAG: restriction endonuclease [Syntrophaceae bacterium]|nr:restriction endonuclease [Syntrophaceae bacterium]
MAVPDFQSFFKPLLEIAADGNEHSLKTARELIAQKMNLSEEDLKELLPSGTQKKFDNRVAWAKTYFVQAKVLESSKRGYFRITERGRELFKKGHEKIDVKVLNQYPEFVEFHTAKTEKSGNGTSPGTESPVETPEETLHKAYQSIRNDLAGEILEKVKSNSPQFFEKLVVDLMVAMGYGGSRSDAGQSIGHSGDEGVDGIIKEDRLGLDVIYLQAKKWEGTVGRPEIQKFVGALHGKRAKKGVFLTTGKFSEDAIRYVETIDPKVILIDGNRLANLMIDFGIGTAVISNLEIKRIDSDYFVEE